jgi:hypothetical protein
VVALSIYFIPCTKVNVQLKIHMDDSWTIFNYMVLDDLQRPSKNSDGSRLHPVFSPWFLRPAGLESTIHNVSGRLSWSSFFEGGSTGSKRGSQWMYNPE